ncbi:copper resistance protein CopC [Streptomyces sp. DSM 41972]|uniref:Copper resistance protein CopC n=1 Tax=Streptomyces althioticus subsp. attaecolombicae TaxID=3075534 RepID=A0ABU3I1C4_9ACTN|nr:copper resistance protein CopC [Streptomyces sp. DSM 41972]SCD31318.1 copper transport protein [Streptomyces sp. di50b]SCE29535.1 copper transport protein [Streptomyces sp. di188]
MTQTIAPRVRTLVLLILAVAGALLAGAAPASAHAALTGSDPAQGAVVDTAPSQVSLTFSEPVAVGDDSVRVLDPKGERVDKGDPANPSGTTYSVPLVSGLPDGTYTVAYQVVSADSHPVAGAFTFSIGAPSETTVSVSAQGSDDGLVGWLYGFGRYVSYAGFVVLAGGAAFVLACWAPGARVRAVQRLVVSGWLALTAATLGLLMLRGSYTTSGKIGDVFDLELLGDVLQTKTGAALVSRLLLLAAAALFIAVLFGAYARTADSGAPDHAAEGDGRSDGEGDSGEPDKRDLTFGLALGGTVVAAGLAASWAMSEHASQGLQAGVAMPVDVVHLLAVAAWLGGLTALLVALHRAPVETPVERDTVRRFSRLAFGSVVALAVTGVYQSWRQLGSWSAFTDTRYGQLLLVKIALVAVMVAVASLSRRWTQRLADARVSVATAESARSEEAERAEEEKQPAGTAPAEASGTSAVSEAVETPTASDAEKTEAGHDSVRAAQLARQRAATEAARQKRLRDADPNRFGLRRSVLAEAGVAVVLLAVTTVLTQTEPGRTEQDAKAAAASSSSSASTTGQGSGAVSLTMPFDTGGTNGKGVVSVDLDPAQAGDNALHVYVEGPDGTPVDVPEVKIALTLAAQDIGPLPVAPDHITTGHWSASTVQIPMAGDWKVEVTVRTSDIDQVTVSKNAQIG